MPIYNGWLPREGLTGDPVGRLIKKTAFNPAFTLAFLLLARFTKKGADLSILHETAFSRIKTLFALGLIRYASAFLDNGVLNNWKSDKYDWNKEIVLITGGAGGIGGHVVKLLAERGIKVVVLDVIPMTFEIPENVYYYKCDITSRTLLHQIATLIRKDVGEPTIIINNAGVARGKSILDASEKDIRFTFEVNTIAHYFMIQEFLPSLIAANHGMVVTVASYAAYMTVPNMVDYASSKAAALSFHEGLTAELKTRYNADKVRTVVVNQGYTRTPLFQGYHAEGQFFVPPLELETVADAIVVQVLKGKSGQIILPGFGALLTFFRGFPHWAQLRLRIQGENIMKGWHGRQVIDVEKWKSAEEREAEGVDASTVLVDNAKE